MREEPSALEAVLYVDDEAQNLELFRLQFEEENSNDFAIETAQSAEAALAILAKSSRIAVLLTDERMPGMRGVELLAQAAQRWPDVVRVIVSAYGDAPRLLAAINLGHAHEYILKPWDKAELGDCLKRALKLATRRRSLGVAAARATHVEADAALTYGKMIGGEGEGGGLAPVLALASRAASSSVPILVSGEHGTGKELIARFIHAESKRPGAFLRIACAQIGPDQIATELFGSERAAGGDVVIVRGSAPDTPGESLRRSASLHDVVVRGRLESASRGSVFLDDVAVLPLAVQAALSHAIDAGAFERVGGQTPIALNTRILASTTHRSLDGLVKEGRFSAELAYHLNLAVSVPPLRERTADIAALALHFAEKHTRPGESPRQIDDDALAALASYTWPGNVRELEGIVARAVALATGPSLGIDDFTFRLDLPSVVDLGGEGTAGGTGGGVAPAVAPTSVREQARTNEALELRKVLLAHGGNIARAARALGLPRTTLLSRAKKLGLLS